MSPPGLCGIGLLFSYSRHRGLLSSRRHTHTCRLLLVLRYSGHFYSHSLREKQVNSDLTGKVNVFYSQFTVRGILTLVAVDSIFPALTGLTGRPIEPSVTPTHSGPVDPVQTRSITKAGTTLQTGTWLAALPEKPSTTPAHLQTATPLTLQGNMAFPSSTCFISESR